MKKNSHRKGMTLEEEYGIERAKAIREKMSKAKVNYIPWIKGKHHTEETKEKLRKIILTEEQRQKRSEVKLKNPVKYWLGKKRSVGTKQKISEANKGKIAWNKGKKGLQISWNKGKTKEDYPQMGNSGVKKGRFIGEKHPNWKGGISVHKYCPEFDNQLKELIRFRDGYKCQKCGCPEIEEDSKLSVHHIDYDKKNCNPDNLISLCRRCNVKVNSNRSKWTKYFNRKVKKIMNSNAIQLNFRQVKKIES